MRETFRQLRELATPRDRREALILGLVVSVTSAVETVAVASFLPFLASLADPEALVNGEILPDALSPWIGSDPASALVSLGLVVLVLLLLASAGSLLTAWLVHRFVWGALHRLASRLLLRYLRQPYTFFLERNSADLSRAILSEVDVAMTGVVIPLIFSVVRSVPAILILGLLVAVDPVVAAVTAGILSGAYGVAYLLIRRRQARAGVERVRANQARFQAAAEALSGIKAVKILGREDAFSARFDQHSLRYAQATRHSEFMAVVPRYILEAVAFGGMVVLVLALLGRGGGLPAVLPLLGLYAFAGYRLLPSLQQIFLSLTRARFHAASIQRLHGDLLGDGRATSHSGGWTPAHRRGDSRTGGDPEAASHAHAGAAVAFEGVSFAYPGSKAAALQDVSFRLEPGGVYGLIGPSGSGKTTAMDLLLGLLHPRDGTVRVLDGIPGTDPAWGPRRVGYVPQDVFLVDDSLAANVALGVPDADVDLERVRGLLAMLELDELVDALPRGVETSVGERGVRISGGQRQRIGIARALYPEPEILVLDEGTSALDGATESRILRRLRDRGRTLLIVAHRLPSIQDADRVLLFHEGRLRAQGTYRELLSRDPLVQAMARETGDGVARDRAPTTD